MNLLTNNCSIVRIAKIFSGLCHRNFEWRRLDVAEVERPSLLVGAVRLRGPDLDAAPLLDVVGTGNHFAQRG